MGPESTSWFPSDLPIKSYLLVITQSGPLKLKRMPIFAIFFLLLFHLPVMFEEAQLARESAKGRSLEAPTLKTGDSFFYRNSILSLLYFSFSERLGVPSRPLPLGKMAELYASLFPFPTNKPGYAWTGAILSSFVPKFFFEKHLPRLLFINLLLSIGTSLLLYSITLLLTKNRWAGLCSSLLFSMDLSVAHTNYHYQSHTLCGVFWSLMGVSLFVRKDLLKPLPIFLFSLCISLAILSSSHVVWIALGLTAILVVYIKKKSGFSNCFHLLPIAFMGGTLPFLYLLSVDWLLMLSSVQIPGWWAQTISYVTKDAAPIHFIPFHYRFMWDIRPVLRFAPVIFSLLCLNFFYWKILNRKIELPPGGKEKIVLLAIALFFGAVGGSFFGLPLVRTIAPFMVFLTIFLGILISHLIKYGDGLCRATALFVMLLFPLNYAIGFAWVPWKNKTPVGSTFLIAESEHLKQNQSAYFRHLNSSDPRPFKAVSSYDYTSKSLSEFIQTYDVQLSITPNLYIKVDPGILAEAYVPTMRLFPLPQFPSWHQVKASQICNDFRLLCELFELKTVGSLNTKDLLEYDKEYFDLGTFDHESGYWLIFKNGIRPFLSETPLNKMDMRKFYYFKYSRLREEVGFEGESVMKATLKTTRNKMPK